MTVVKVPLLPVQSRFMRCTSRFHGMFTGIGYGKTRTGALKTVMLAATNPRCLGLAIANSDQQVLAVIIPAIRQAMKVMRVRYRFNKSERTFTVANGAQILCRSASGVAVDTIRGINADFMWIDEARDLTEYAFSVLVGRVGRRKGMRPNPMTFLTTTTNGYNWMYRRFGPGRKNKVDYQPFHASTFDNPTLPKKTLAILAESYDDRTREQELEGAWVAAGKVLYYAFSRRRNISRKAVYDPAHHLIVGLDFNIDYCVAIICQERNGVLLVVDEIYDTSGMGTPSVIKTFKERYPEAVNVQIFGDPAGHNRDTRSGSSDYELWRMMVDCRIAHRQAAPPIVDRVNATNGWLYSSVDHQTRTFINPKCIHLIEDLESVLPEKDGSKRPRKTKGQEHLTHPSDALGYIISELHPVRRVLDRAKLAAQDDREMREFARI